MDLRGERSLKRVGPKFFFFFFFFLGGCEVVIVDDEDSEEDENENDTHHIPYPPSLIPTSCIQTSCMPCFSILLTRMSLPVSFWCEIIMLWEGNCAWYYDSKVPLRNTHV